MTVVAVVVATILVAVRLPASDALKHDTDRWAVIEDTWGDRMAVETTEDAVWAQLVEMKENGTELWVGGAVERYGNAWGFRFRPDSIVIAEVTAEGLQSTIEDISADIDYWMGLSHAYVWARVLSVHPGPDLPGPKPVRWAVIEDTCGDQMAVETTDDAVWAQLVEMKENGTELWVGGVVERYNNTWGYRFRPDSIVIAEVTAEALQSTIRDISSDIDYWIGLGQAFVFAGVDSTHEA